MLNKSRFQLNQYCKDVEEVLGDLFLKPIAKIIAAEFIGGFPKLEVGTEIDCQDSEGVWCSGIVIKVMDNKPELDYNSHQNKISHLRQAYDISKFDGRWVLVHFRGWKCEFDEWIAENDHHKIESIHSQLKTPRSIDNCITTRKLTSSEVDSLMKSGYSIQTIENLREKELKKLSFEDFKYLLDLLKMTKKRYKLNFHD